MKLRFTLSGSVLFETESDCVPTIGSTIQIRTESYKKGLHAGSIISGTIAADEPPLYDYTEENGVVVYIDVNGYTLVEEGPSPD